MKFFLAFLGFSLIFFAPTKAQLSKAIIDIGLPCVSEIGLTSDVATEVQKGNFIGALGKWSCFADCVSQKVGIVNADYVFQVDNFKGRLNDFVLPGRIEEFMTTCQPKIGEGKCKASGEFYHCIANVILKEIFE
ncbi:uncharacterized protein LOC132265827 [Phlebotomus argentipes]|uniref:uncharacterized protein LOC132265827 n=1 Tax=Phlebotomus argentipes TaxID=94469 RepID=UPI002892FBC1|nr:uncharacterized protein LOC132265827 [Phlebotomus argentipes]